MSPLTRSVAAHVRALDGANFKKWSLEEAKRERDREIRIEQEKLRKQHEELQKLLAEILELEEKNVTDAVVKDEEVPSSLKRRRRGGSSIDYVALNAQLEKEAQGL